MQDALTRARNLHRPALLTRAAHYAATHTTAKMAVRRQGKLLGSATSWGASRRLTALLDIEADLNAQRKNRDAAYSPSRHVDVLAAVMVQAQEGLQTEASEGKAPRGVALPDAPSRPGPNVIRLPPRGAQPVFVSYHGQIT